MGRLRQRARAALTAITWVVLATSLAGCGEAREDAVDPAPVTSPSPLEIDDPLSTQAPFATEPGSCAGAEFYLDDVFLDAATGHRYLALRLRNCSDRIVTLEGAPRLTLRAADGRVVEPWTRLWESRSPVRVPPGEHAFLGLEYVAADRKPLASAVILSVAGRDLTITGELDLDVRTRLTVYPWVTATEDLWGA